MGNFMAFYLIACKTGNTEILYETKVAMSLKNSEAVVLGSVR